MKVKTLIKELGKYDLNAEVRIVDPAESRCYKINDKWKKYYYCYTKIKRIHIWKGHHKSVISIEPELNEF